MFGVCRNLKDLRDASAEYMKTNKGTRRIMVMAIDFSISVREPKLRQEVR